MDVGSDEAGGNEVTKPPKMTAALRKERLSNMSAKRDIDMSTNKDVDKGIKSDIEIGAPAPAPAATPKTLPKVTLYAHQDVLTAIRRVAVDDGVQAQEILRRAVRDYLATRGYHFEDLTTGR